jgi:acid phosphatase
MRSARSFRVRVALYALIASIAFAAARGGSAPAQTLPQPDKIVVVIEENRPYRAIIDSPTTPYINELARKGALFTRAFGVAHPSQPNYIALLSGSPAGVDGNDCLGRPIQRDNLASLLIAKYGEDGFATFSEFLPKRGYTGCRTDKNYVRKHNPVVNWQGAGFQGAVPAAANRPFSEFPDDPAQLPRVSFVVPSQDNDMHDGESKTAERRADTWLKRHLDRYVAWAQERNSLLVVTWDEDDSSADNHIPMIMVGPMVRPGARHDERVDHYTLLRTLLDMHGLPAIGEAARRKPIRGIWLAAR